MTRYLLSPVLIILPILVLFSGMAMTPLLVIFALTGAAIAFKTLPAQFKTLRYTLLCLGLIVIWPFITVLWSITLEHSLGQAIQVAALAMIGLLAFAAAPSFATPNPRTYYYMAAHTALVGVVLLLEQLLQHGLLYEIMTALGKDYERFMVKNINRGLCALTVLIWPLVLGLVSTGQRRSAWWAVTLLLIGILAMHSLSAKLGLAAGIAAFYAIPRFPRFAPRAIAILIPLFLLSFPIVFKLMDATLFEHTEILAHLPPSSLHRLAIWDIDMHLVAQKWLLGWGMDASRALPFTHEELTALSIGSPPLHPHSPSIQVLIEQGVVGFLLTIAAIALLLRKWMQMEQGQSKTALGALAVSYFVSGASSFGVWQGWWIATLFIALFLWRIAARPQA